MTPVPRAETLKVELLEDRTNPTAVIPNDVLNADPNTYAAGQLLFGLAPGADRTATLTALGNSPWASTAQEVGFGVFKLTLRAGVTVRQAMDGLNGNGQLGFVEPDFKISPDRLPNDPKVQNGDQWGVNNYGQNGGTPDKDIDGPEAWTTARGTGNTIVAVLDDGIDYTHPDLAGNMWTNTGEVDGDGIDNDGNGYVDDIHGYNFVTDDGDIAPEAGDEHGTHVAGTIGAVGDNGLGVSGVSWKTRLMGLKIYAASGPATTNALISGVVSAFNYAVANGAKILNNSWKYYGPQSAAFTAAVANAQANGVIAAVSAGNDGKNNETYDRWPSNFTLYFDNVVAVAATDHNDDIANFSNFSDKMVQVGAPGVDIWSTIPGGYDTFDGTSMATPHVAGALSVVWDAYPSLTSKELVQLLYATVDPDPALVGKTTTGGRLNLNRMLQNATFGGYAVGADAGGGPVVKVFAKDGTQRSSFFAFPSTFTGGVRIAMADVNGDRVPDIIAVPGTGGGPVVKVFDGRTQAELYSFYAYPTAFTAGMYVAAGDMDGDGQAEVITGAAEGGGSVVRAFKLLPGGHIKQLANFYAFDPGFAGGVRVSAGDMNLDGKSDIVTSAGFGGSPFVRTFDGAAAATGARSVIREFMAGDAASTGGAYVTIGHINNDSGFADYIVGSGDASREVRVYNGRTLSFTGGFNAYPPNQTAAPAATDTSPTVGGLIGGSSAPTQLPAATQAATAATTKRTGGFRVAVLDLNNDGVDDIIAGGGPGDESIVRVRNGRSMTTLGVDHNVFGNVFSGGVFVAASR